MSPLLVAALAFAVPPSEEAEKAAAPPAQVAVEPSQPGAEPVKKAPPAPRTGPKLRDAVRAALRRWGRASEAESEAAAREFLILHRELRADNRLSRSQREYFLQRVRFRLIRLSDQISRQIAREKRLAKSRGETAGDQGEKLASPGDYVPGGASSPAFGGGAMQIPDHGQELVDLIQTVIRPETWDVNGGTGSIYYWYPGRALVIRQMDDVHGEVSDVLDQLRRAGR